MTYSSTLTGVLSSVSPRYGAVTGGDSITFTGSGLSSTSSDYTITIDGVDCPVSSASFTEVVCVTGERLGLVDSSLEIYIDGYGYVSNNEVIFKYVSLWSDETTWGGDFAPIEGDSVHIPAGLNLLVDIDSTPELNAILVEGSLTFVPDDDDESTDRYFDARYIFVNGGAMEVGTEEFPYSSKLTITLHGSIYDPYIPIYGNKVLGVRHGQLDMIGVERTPTWTALSETAEAGATTITLKEAVDWVVGENIAIASGDYEGRHAEERTITAIDDTDPDAPILTLDKALVYQHFAELQIFGDEEIDTRSEVGLLSRNVRFRGDPETSKLNQYGATLFMHSPGDDSLSAHLYHIELMDVGQAF